MPTHGSGETSSTTPDPQSLDFQLCFAVYSASHLMTRLYHPLLAPLGLTYLQYMALMALWERAPQTVGDLTRRLGLDSGTLTPLFKRMEAAGLVRRERDPVDERRVIIKLTDAGREMRTKTAGVPAQVFCQLPMPISEAAHLKGLVETLIEGLRVNQGKAALPISSS